MRTYAPRNESYTVRLASEKQVNFVKNLMSEREAPEAELAYIGAQVAAGTLNSRDASAFIDKALASPRKPQAATVVGNPLALLLMTIPAARYAIPVQDVDTLLTDTESGTNDTFYVEVRQPRSGHYKGRKFLNRLHGGFPGFRSTRFAPEDSLIVARYLADETRALAAATRFGVKHKVCASCGADLTEPDSQRLGLGPTCRQHFGLK